jgi:serine/threonine protein phosphatase 1
MIHARVNGAVVPEWLGFGGEATMVSYHAFTMSGIPREHWEFIEQIARPWAELENEFFVHATVKPDLPLADQDDVSIYWDAFRTDLGPHCSGKRMVCGHTAQKSGLPLDIGHAVCIDTKVYSPTGWLTALDLETGDYWQANQAGRTRRSSLAELTEARSG